MVNCFYSPPPSNVLVNSSPTPSPPQIRIIFLLQFSLLKRLLYNSESTTSWISLTMCVQVSDQLDTSAPNDLNSIYMYCLNYQLKSKPSRALGARLVHRVFWCTPRPFFFSFFFSPQWLHQSCSGIALSLFFEIVSLTDGDRLTSYHPPSILISCLQTFLSDWVALGIKIHQKLLIFKIFVLRIQSVYIPLYLYVYTVYFLDIWTTVTGSHK